ncbi:MAG: THUMP domain-containing protein [Promethearchaeota archaeon]
MEPEFNLFVSVMKGFETPACEEMKDLLEQLGDPNPEAKTTIARGLIYAYTNLDPFIVIKRVRDLVWDDEFRYPLLLKIRPIERVVETDLEEIKRVCTELAEKKIDKYETFRITLERRFTDVPRDELIDVAASNIDRQVDLNNPDKVVFVEVLEESTGIAVILPEDELSILKEREIRDFTAFEDQLKKDEI